MPDEATTTTATADAAATTDQATTDQAATGPAGDGAGENGTDWKEEARKWERRAKENRDAARELEKQRQASMTEAERAVADAESRGRQAATSQFGQRLARAEFDSAAGRRNAGFDTGPVFEYLDLGRFVGDDGEPDTKAINAAVERLIPAPETGPPGFDGGTRATGPAPAGMTDLIRRATGRT